MTVSYVTLRPYEAYLHIDPGQWGVGREEECVDLYLNLLGLDQGQDVLALVAALVAAGRIPALRSLYADHTALHEAIEEAGGSQPSQKLSRRLDPPFRAGEPASLHALRALAALGLALAEDEPDPDLLRTALVWQKEARGTPAGVAAPWTPAALAGGDLPLRQCLERLAEAAGPDRDSLATLAVAATLRCLRWPTVEPRTEMLLSDPGLAAEGPVPARRLRSRRLPGLARRARRNAITALVDQGATGTAALLTLTVDGGLPAGLIPDPERMSLFAADEGFQDALGRAWRQAGQGRVQGLVTWSAITAEGPLRYAGGESAGAAFAVLLDEARRLARPLAGLTVIRRVVSQHHVL